MVQSCLPGGGNVPSNESTLAPPGEYDWTCVSFCQPESITQTACLHSSRQSVVGHIGATWRIRLNLCFLWPTQVHNLNGRSIGSADSAQLTAEYPCTLQWTTLSPKIAPSHKGYIWTPSNKWFPGPNRVLNPAFFAGLTGVTDRPTVWPHYSVGNNRPHLRICTTAMRRNNNLIFIAPECKRFQRICLLKQVRFKGAVKERRSDW